MGEVVHGEAYVDGDASSVSAVLYKAGSTTVRTLGAKEVLHITSWVLNDETGGDVAVEADGAADGEYLFIGSVIAKDVITHSYESGNEFICAPGTGITFVGSSGATRSLFTFQGYITSA